ncbi:MAG TPA: ABC transporter substrate-binding protein [Succinivibrionaceae bacterium]|nr:ABC transporter substrate-binding protein [Succinivibrionaceae bacterium]
MKKTLTFLFSTALLIFSSSSFAKTQKILISVPDSTSSYVYYAAMQFATTATQYSNNSLFFEIKEDGKMYHGDTAYGIKQIEHGTIPMLILSASVYGNKYPSMNIICLPYLFKDQKELVNFLNSDKGSAIINQVNKNNITVVGKWTRSFREITNSKRPIQKVEDLKDLRLRVPKNPLYVEFFNACGAETMEADFSSVYGALDDGTIDGQENPVEVPAASGFYDVQTYISMSDHMSDAWIVGINSALFKSLTPEQQDAIIRAGEYVQKWNVNMINERDKFALNKLTRNGMKVNQISAEEKKRFAEVAKSCYPSFRKLINDDKLFDAVVANYE